MFARVCAKLYRKTFTAAKSQRINSLKHRKCILFIARVKFFPWDIQVESQVVLLWSEGKTYRKRLRDKTGFSLLEVEIEFELYQTWLATKSLDLKRNWFNFPRFSFPLEFPLARWFLSLNVNPLMRTKPVIILTYL